jgi:hypothetical protein
MMTPEQQLEWLSTFGAEVSFGNIVVTISRVIVRSEPHGKAEIIEKETLNMHATGMTLLEAIEAAKFEMRRKATIKNQYQPVF